MVNIVKCSYGHYYDSIEFSKCPHCETKNFDRKESSQYKQQISKYAWAYIQEQITKVQSDSFVQKKSSRPRNEVLDETFTLKDPMKRRIMGGERTVGFTFKDKKDYFVIGWLVCTEGPDIGHSFNLYYGYNTIGCRITNSIFFMDDDGSAAKDVYCSIVYEDKKNQSYLVPEKDTKIFLNGMLIEKPEILLSGDIIRIGQTEFEFIAFCRENRKWDKKYLKIET